MAITKYDQFDFLIDIVPRKLFSHWFETNDLMKEGMNEWIMNDSIIKKGWTNQSINDLINLQSGMI